MALSMARSSLLALSILAAAAACAAPVGCGGSGALGPPQSDKQQDDPCDPGTGGSTTGPAPAVDAGAAPVPLPGGTGGIGFDDLRFSPTLSMLLVPAGRTGNVDLVDPSSEAISPVGGFSTEGTYSGDDSFGVTSADEGNAIVYAVDRTSKTLAVIDPKKKAIVAQATLAATPGYVRYVAPTNEVWVTEPGQQQIEIFALGTNPSAAPTHATTIGVSRGPESLEIDVAGKRAYTHSTGATVAIDVAGRSVVASWPNGCATSRGIAVDSGNHWVMSACEEGMVVVLSMQGATIGTVPVGAGVDQIAYDAARTRLYVPGPAAGAMTVVGLAAATGAPSVLGSVQTPNDTHCAVTNGGGSVFVCAPSLGALLFINDPF
jgi:DNA-binding beta-propeller fold protein YncE